MIHITGTGATQLPPAAGIKATINLGFTGSLTLTDANGVVQAIVTNPATGQEFNWYGTPSSGQNGGTLTASAVGDITVSVLSRNQA
jgi:hypothetical protein